jgi:microcystin-dependent protein
MTEPFVGEIRIFGFNFAPQGWAFCNGLLFPISQNTALFSLLGTFYGGDGKSTFALPNLQGSAPLKFDQGPGLSDYSIGEQGGAASVTLASSELPLHTHQVSANSGTGLSNDPAAHTWARAHTGKTPYPMYSGSVLNPVSMSAQALGTAGSSAPHNNMPPYLVLNFCIALQGIFPARS